MKLLDWDCSGFYQGIKTKIFFFAEGYHSFFLVLNSCLWFPVHSEQEQTLANKFPTSTSYRVDQTYGK